MFTRISQRLTALISVAIAGLLLVGGNGPLQLQQVAGLLSDVADNVLPSVVLIEEAKSSYLEARVQVLYHIVEKEPAGMETRARQANEQLAMARAALKRYEALVVDAEDRKLLDASTTALAAYVEGLPRLLQMSAQQEKEAGLAYIRETQGPLGVAARNALEAQAAYNVKAAENLKKRAHDTIAQARFVLVSASLAVIAFLLWMGTGSYRMIVGTANRARDDVTRVVRELDFSRPLEVNGQDELSDLLRALNQLIERLRDGLSAVRDNADSLANASAQLATVSAKVQRGSGDQSDAASSMAASVEQMTVSISHVSDRTSEASSLTRESGEQAAGGRASVSNIAGRVGGIAQLVDEAVNELGRLEDSGRQISTVVAVIKDVADQTNLLALNAAIEAARAGEQGRGFAVVADEVRKLAERTASSTIEIAGMVEAIQQRSAQVALRMNEAVASVREGVSEAGSASASMEQIANSADRSCNLVGEIANALREQSIASNTIAGQVEKVAHMADENSHAATRSAELAGELQGLASAMQQTVAAYRLS